MIYFGKDLVEGERRFAVVRAGYAALCCTMGAPALLVFCHYRSDDWFIPILAALTVVGGIVNIWKCWGAGMGPTPCDCEEQVRGAAR